MSATYTIAAANAFGQVTIPALTYQSLRYVLREMREGYARITLDARRYHRSQFPRHSRLLIYRSVGGGIPQLDGNAVWIVYEREYSRNERGETTLTLLAYHANRLLNHRIAAYPAGTSQSRKSGTVGAMMQAIVEENLLTATDAARNLPAGYLSIGPIATGPTLSKGFSWRNILFVLQELAEQSAALGSYYGFEVRSNGSTGLQFTTYRDQRGINRGIGSAAPLILSAANGTLASETLIESWINEATVVYAAGEGSESDREIAIAINTTDAAETPIGRVEALRDMRTWADAGNVTALQRGADETLQQRRSMPIVRARFQETRQIIYGRDIGWGDQVAVFIDGLSVNVRVDPVEVAFDQADGETLNITLTNELVGAAV